MGGTPYMKTALQVCDLEKSFKKYLFSKKRTILQGLSFSLIKGEVTGFLGPNGSGKTTALKCILGLMPYDKGKVLFFPRPRVGGDKGCGQILPRGHDQRTGPQTVPRPRVGGDKGCGRILPRGHDQKTGPQTVPRFAGPRVGGDKGCGQILPRGHDRRTGPQTVPRFAGPRVGGDKGCGQILPRGHDQRTGPQTVTRFAGRRVGGDKGCGQILPRGHDRRTGPQTVPRFAGLLSREILSRVGFLPEEPCFYDYLTAEELLIFYGRLSSNLKKPDLKIKVRKWLKKLGIEGAKDQKIKTFSKGMLRKVGLAQALMFEPELLILDEPLAGLDPDSRKQVCQIIKDHAKLLGGAVFFSSHLIDDVQKTCDKIVTLPKTPLNPQEP